MNAGMTGAGLGAVGAIGRVVWARGPIRRVLGPRPKFSFRLSRHVQVSLRQGAKRERYVSTSRFTLQPQVWRVVPSRMLLAARQRAGSPLAGAAERPPCGCALTVIARWRENLDWTWKLRMPFVVMDKAAGNVGRESLSFLHFIVENYASRLTEMAENASACVCFTQGIISGSQFGCDHTARGHRDCR